MKVKTSYDGCEYITAGKEYEVHYFNNGYCDIIDDDGAEIGIWLKACPHLGNVGTWEVVDNETN